MPTRARRMAKEGWKEEGDLVPFVPERLRAGLELSGIPRREAARRLGITPQRLDYYVRPRNPKAVGERYRCRPRHRRALARMTGLPEAWLAGEMRHLPWARERWEDIQWRMWPNFHWLIYALRGIAAREEKPDSAVVRVRRLVAVLQDTMGLLLPRHLQSVRPPLPVSDLRHILTAVENWLTQSPLRVNEASRYQAQLEEVEHSWAFHSADQPSIGQVVEYRLIGRCWRAWSRDIKLRFPDFSPEQLPEPIIRSGRAANWVIRYPAPWDEWFGLEDDLHRFLSVGVWRDRMLRGDSGRAITDEELSAVRELGHALEAILRPWLDGEAGLMPAGLLPFGTSPRIGRRRLPAGRRRGRVTDRQKIPRSPGGRQGTPPPS